MKHLWLLATLLVTTPSAAVPRVECRADLLDPQKEARRQELLSELKGLASMQAFARGAAFELPGDAGTLQRVGEWIALENRCCAFLRFRVTWKGGDAPIRVRVTGPAGTGALVQEALRRVPVSPSRRPSDPEPGPTG